MSPDADIVSVGRVPTLRKLLKVCRRRPEKWIDACSGMTNAVVTEIAVLAGVVAGEIGAVNRPRMHRKGPQIIRREAHIPGGAVALDKVPLGPENGSGARKIRDQEANRRRRENVSPIWLC